MSRRRPESPYWPHSDPNPTDEQAGRREALDGTQACVLGCLSQGQHLPGCPCHDQCPEHPGHCTGCAARPARGDSLLCGRCYHRRLRSPLRQLPTIHAWLGAQMGGLLSSWREPGVSGTRETPLPINADMHDHRQVIDRELLRWARRVGGEHDPPIASPSSWDAAAVCRWLEVQASWIARQEWVVELAGVLQELVSEAEGMAAWRQKRTPLPLPCPKCQRSTLTLFGGEDWVTCVASDCDEIIGWYRYSRLVNAIVALHQHHGETA